jgi:hypothetical protein
LQRARHRAGALPTAGGLARPDLDPSRNSLPSAEQQQLRDDKADLAASDSQTGVARFLIFDVEPIVPFLPAGCRQILDIVRAAGDVQCFVLSDPPIAIGCACAIESFAGSMYTFETVRGSSFYVSQTRAVCPPADRPLEKWIDFCAGLGPPEAR